VVTDPTTADPIVTMCVALKLANRAKVAAMRIDRVGPPWRDVCCALTSESEAVAGRAHPMMCAPRPTTLQAPCGTGE
jgi:hypothetical protein